MSAPPRDASSALAAPIAAASRHDSSWKAIAEHFAKRCLCHRETKLPQSPAVKARAAPLSPVLPPKPQPAPRPLHWLRCSRVCHKLLPPVCPHPSPAPNKQSPRLHHRAAPPPAKYLLCSAHPAHAAASQLAPACYPAPQRPHKPARPAPKTPTSRKAVT